MKARHAAHSVCTAAAMLLALAAALACALVVASSPAPALARPDPAAPRDAAARGLFDSIRQIIREGDEALGVPPLDPFSLAFANGSFVKSGAYAVDGEVRDLTVTGLADFDGSISGGLSGITGVKIKVAVAVPALRLNSGYDFSGTVVVRGQEVVLYGNGPLEVDVDNIDVSVEVVITLLTQKIRSISTSIDIGNIEVVVDGLLGNMGALVNPFISAVVSELANELFDEQKEALEQAVSDALKDPLQSALDSFSLDDILCLLGLCSQSAVMEAMKEAAAQNVDGETYSM